MAAHAVQLLTPYVKNYVIEMSGSVMVPSPVQIDIPALPTFTLIPVTGTVIARTSANFRIISSRVDHARHRSECKATRPFAWVPTGTAHAATLTWSVGNIATGASVAIAVKIMSNGRGSVCGPVRP